MLEGILGVKMISLSRLSLNTHHSNMRKWVLTFSLNLFLHLFLPFSSPWLQTLFSWLQCWNQCSYLSNSPAQKILAAPKIPYMWLNSCLDRISCSEILGNVILTCIATLFMSSANAITYDFESTKHISGKIMQIATNSWLLSVQCCHSCHQSGPWLQSITTKRSHIKTLLRWWIIQHQNVHFITI